MAKKDARGRGERISVHGAARTRDESMGTVTVFKTALGIPFRLELKRKARVGEGGSGKGGVAKPRQQFGQS